MPTDLPENPLAACPGTPNCARASRAYPDAPDLLLLHVENALVNMNPSEQTRDGDRFRLVFRVVFFKDDLELLVAPHGEGSVLHARSASRAGKYDFGVNQRRLDRFFAALERVRG